MGVINREHVTRDAERTRKFWTCQNRGINTNGEIGQRINTNVWEDVIVHSWTYGKTSHDNKEDQSKEEL